ncbi:MetS family NSS transporter small subunit [Vallitalea okinawensis]|nr:MetS family NSS transporter small subunit [Vallitalea okinawensis]
MSTSAIIFAIIAMGLLWGGFGICLTIAMKNQ